MLGLEDVQITILGFPLVDRRIAHAVLTPQIGDGNSGLMLLQNADNQVVGEPTVYYLRSLRLGKSQTSNWIRPQG